MKGTLIQVCCEPGGREDEGTIVGTPKPGIMVETVPGTPYANGRPSYRPCQRGAGVRGPVAILKEDSLQGKTYADAYTNGSRCFVYYPNEGEDMNVRAEVLGTGTGAANLTVGQKLMLSAGTDGRLTPSTGSPASEPFEVQETMADSLDGEVLVWVKYTGY